MLCLAYRTCEAPSGTRRGLVGIVGCVTGTKAEAHNTAAAPIVSGRIRAYNKKKKEERTHPNPASPEHVRSTGYTVSPK